MSFNRAKYLSSVNMYPLLIYRDIFLLSIMLWLCDAFTAGLSHWQMGLQFSLTEQMRWSPAGDGGGLDFGHMLAVLSGQPRCPWHPRCVVSSLLSGWGILLGWYLLTVVYSSVIRILIPISVMKNEDKICSAIFYSLFRGWIVQTCFHSYLVHIDPGH